uniref:Putative secreted peptide n=1 Tax=Anopheles braziliensis TaxID=58242 RepID=A0A2M3ZUH2_9DIPT
MAVITRWFALRLSRNAFALLSRTLLSLLTSTPTLLNMICNVKLLIHTSLCFFFYSVQFVKTCFFRFHFYGSRC